jgi:hypothetical protein
MTECPEPGARALTFSDVPDSQLAEYGFHRGGAPAESYTCSEPAAVLVPIGEVSGPNDRKLNEESTVFPLCSWAAGRVIKSVSTGIGQRR